MRFASSDDLLVPAVRLPTIGRRAFLFLVATILARCQIDRGSICQYDPVYIILIYTAEIIG